MWGKHHLFVFLILVPALLPLAGCGWATGGVAGLSSGSSGGGGATNAAPSLADLSLQNSRISPATIVFSLTDSEGDLVDVQLFYAIDGAPSQPVALADGEEELNGLTSSSTGVRHERKWDFASQIGSGFQSEVTVTVEIIGESERPSLPEPVTEDINAPIGNDAPEITNVLAAGGEVVGIAAVEMTVSDSSSDVVSVQLEYDVVGDETGFLPATAVRGTPTDVLVTPNGAPFTFVWDVINDEGFTENDVILRLTPNDGDLPGQPQQVNVRIDNNTRPTAILNSAHFLNNTDRSGGIPLPFTIFDGSTDTGEPADPVQLVFQWRTEDGTFPSLPSDPSEIESILADPDRRKELQIATQLPRIFRGLAAHAPTQPDNENAVRLPELATSAASLPQQDSKTQEISLQGEIEIFRASIVPRAQELPAGLLEKPVAAVPIPGTLNAFVLDSPSGGGWRVQEIDLGSGEVVGLNISDPTAGTPTAMALESNGSVIIASVTAGVWQVQRAGAQGVTLLATADGSTENAPIREIAARGNTGSLLTLGSSLVSLRYSPGEPATLSELFSPTADAGPLQAPWGIALDSLNPDQVYIAENGADRILVLDLATLKKSTLVANGPGFPSPQSLALERTGGRLLVVTDADSGDGHHELRALDLRDPTDLDGGGADSSVFEIQQGFETAPELVGSIGSLATGAENLRVLTLTTSNDLAIGGGIEQVRTIAAYDHPTQTVQVSAPFNPPFLPNKPLRPWRIVGSTSNRFRASPEGTLDSYLWDSNDTDDDNAVLRVTPYDSEAGTGSSTNEPKLVFPRFGGQTVAMGDTALLNDNMVARAGDLDGDGDLDVASANFRDGSYALFFQTAPGIFSPGEVIGDPNVLQPSDLELADLDQDGDLDIVSQYLGAFGDFSTLALIVFFQTSPGVFDSGMILPSNASEVAAADLDSDGDIDIAASNRFSEEIDLFFQTSPGVFTQGPSIPENGSRLTTGDLDADGDVDLAFLNQGMVLTYHQTQPGVFEQGPSFMSNDDAASRLALFDLDANGHLDIAFTEGGGFGEDGTVTLLFQASDGSFEPGQVIQSPGTKTSLDAGDVDGDGNPDLIVGSSSDPHIAVFRQTQPRQFVLDSSLGNRSNGAFVTSADFNGDGALDLLSADNQLDVVTVYYNRIRGEFTEGPILGGADDSEGLDSTVTGDLDGDGDLDFATANVTAETLTVFFQTTPGDYELGVTVPTVRSFTLARGDLDNDGDLDLVAAMEDTVLLILQTAPGVFEPGPTVKAPGVNTIKLGDFEGDGDLDLVALGTSINPIVTVFRHQEPLQFERSQELGDVDPNTPNAALRNTALEDLDGDGALDIIVPGQQDKKITVFHQTAPGFFKLGQVIEGTSSPLDPVQLQVADFDGNGRPDLLTLIEGPFPGQFLLAILPQTDQGEFSDPIPIGSFLATLGLSGFAVDDVDGDGDLDIALASFFNRLKILYQIRPFVYREGPVLGEGFLLAQRAILEDFDGDGDLDVATSELFPGNLTIFFGSH